MENEYFAQCRWIDEDLDELEGIGLLTIEEREKFKETVTRVLEDEMCIRGWEVLEWALDEFNNERDKE